LSPEELPDKVKRVARTLRWAGVRTHDLRANDPDAGVPDDDGGTL